MGPGKAGRGTKIHCLLFTVSACLRQGLAFLAQNFDLADPPTSVSGVLEVQACTIELSPAVSVFNLILLKAETKQGGVGGRTQLSWVWWHF